MMAAYPAYNYTYKLCRVSKNLLKKQNPKPTPQWKLDKGKEITDAFEKSNKLFIFHYNGLSSNEWSDLRFDMRQENLKVKVFRNQLVHEFLGDTKYANVCSLFKSETAIAFTSEDTNLKSLLKIFRLSPKIELLAAVIDNTIMNKQGIMDYSKLPSLEESRVELLQILSQPTSSLSRLLQTSQSNLSRSLSLYVEQSSGGTSAE